MKKDTYQVQNETPVENEEYQRLRKKSDWGN